jgi:D-sedoheptulose 7-phosphate isomerase
MTIDDPILTLLGNNVNDNSSKPKNSTSAQLLNSSLREHLETFHSLIAMRMREIEQSGQAICDALLRGNKILLCGNGGSAADAQHIATELVGRYEKQRRSWPAISLTTDTSALTAVSNDFGYEEVFARQVEGLGKAGDVLIAISTSGKSPSILKAAKKARELGCHTIALTGAGAEPLASLCDLAVVVPAARTSRVQEAHITIGHLWCEMVDQLES